MVAAQCVLRHRSPGDVQTGFVEAGEEEAGVAVAHVRLAASGVGQVRERGFGDAVGAIAATREPHRVESGIRHHLAQSGEPRRVGSGEMSVGEEALGVDHELAIAASGDNRLDGLSGLALQSATGGDHGDAHWQGL